MLYRVSAEVLCSPFLCNSTDLGRATALTQAPFIHQSQLGPQSISPLLTSSWLGDDVYLDLPTLSHLQSGSSISMVTRLSSGVSAESRPAVVTLTAALRYNMLWRPAHGKGQPASGGSKSWTGRLKTAETGRPEPEWGLQWWTHGSGASSCEPRDGTDATPATVSPHFPNGVTSVVWSHGETSKVRPHSLRWEQGEWTSL